MAYYVHDGHVGHYNPESSFDPVDPFKPSIEYSLRNIWSRETHARPSGVRTHQPTIVLGQGPPFPSRSFNLRSAHRRRRRSDSSPSDTSLNEHHAPTVIQVRRRTDSHSRSSSPNSRSRRRRHSTPRSHLVASVQPTQPSLTPSEVSDHERPRCRVHPSRSSSPRRLHEISEPALALPVFVGPPGSPERSPSERSQRRERSGRRRSPKPVGLYNPIDLREPPTSVRSSSISPSHRPVVQRRPSIVLRSSSGSIADIQPTFAVHREQRRSPQSSLDNVRYSRRRRRKRERYSESPGSLRHLPLVHGPATQDTNPPLETPIDNPLRTRRRRLRVYTAREKSSSPEKLDGPAPSVLGSATESVLASNVLYLPPASPRPPNYSPPFAGDQTFPVRAYILAFILDTLPRQIYLHMLLRLPYLYFTRVIRILEETNLSLPQIKRNIRETAQQNISYTNSVIQYGNLERTWGLFIDSLIEEWKTLNIISVLLLSSILAIISMTNNDPLIRFPALVSMIAALLSLIYGCMYTIRFQTMRKGFKAIEWADECENTKTAIFWNVWVFLAMPATWLAWSLIFFVVCLISFIWRAGSLDDEKIRELSSKQALLPRIIASCIFGVGFVYLILIISTLRRYGSLMDQKWKARVRSWLVAPGFNYSGTRVKPVPSIVGTPQYPSGLGSLGRTWTAPVPTYHSEIVSPPHPDRPYNMASSSSDLARRRRHSTARRKSHVHVKISNPRHGGSNSIRAEASNPGFSAPHYPVAPSAPPTLPPTSRPQSRAQSLQNVEPIQPVTVQSSMPSPDNFTPSVNADNRIRIPPPLDWYRTPESVRSMKALPIPPPEHSSSHHRRLGHTGSSRLSARSAFVPNFLGKVDRI